MIFHKFDYTIYILNVKIAHIIHAKYGPALLALVVYVFEITTNFIYNGTPRNKTRDNFIKDIARNISSHFKDF